MADVFTKKKRSQVMASIRSQGNKDTEIKLVSILRSNRISGWRRHQTLPGKPDFVFRKERLAIFVDGCFWHGCPKHGRKPDTNQKYWQSKLERNIRRDRHITHALKRLNWHVIRIWEHALRHPMSVANRIKRALAKSPVI